MDTFLTIAATAEGIYKEKGSKFLAFAYCVENENQVKEKLEALRKEYYDARHYCYAYIIGKNKELSRSNDDGEPNGTAGFPIIGQIKSKGLTNVLIVVVRYFGGTKLGASGLINAYKTAAADALANANIIEQIVFSQFIIQFDYVHTNEVMKIIKDYELKILNQQFDNECNITLIVRQSLEAEVIAKLEKNQSVKIINSGMPPTNL